MVYNPYMEYYHYPYYGNPFYIVRGQTTYRSFPMGTQNAPMVGSYHPSVENTGIPLKDYGLTPFVININDASKRNNTYRTALWTGNHLQVTLMSINVGDDIGLEVHPTVDQFLRVEQGQGIVQMGKSRERLDYVRRISDDSAIMIPAGFWHNVTNTGNIPLKLYSIYAPPNHPFGTIDRTKADAIAREESHHMQ